MSLGWAYERKLILSQVWIYFWCLIPLSITIQLYRGGSFITNIYRTTSVSQIYIMQNVQDHSILSTSGKHLHDYRQ
jgi:hypothetical protein